MLDIVNYDYGAVPGPWTKVELTLFPVPSPGYCEDKEVHKRRREVVANPGGGLVLVGVLGIEGSSWDSLDVYFAGLRVVGEGESFKDCFRIGPKAYRG